MTGRGRHRLRATHAQLASAVGVVVAMAAVAGISVVVIAIDTGSMPGPSARLGGGTPSPVVSPASGVNGPAGWAQ